MLKLRCKLLAVFISLVATASAGAYICDANDFATEVVSYVQGTNIPRTIDFEYYNDPSVALGGPTVMTKYSNDGWADGNEPVNPVFPAWLVSEIVAVGNGGSLVLKFNHPVGNDLNNPYGIDFIVYGNARFGIEGNWQHGANAGAIFVNGFVFAEPGIVSVSQDGITWYTYSDANAPRADTFAPTASYRWDYTRNAWDVNSPPLDPTRPLDPNLRGADFAGLSVAGAVDKYNGSAGGTGFDLAVFGLDWIQYVRIEDDPGRTQTTEVDAIADVSACGDYRHPFPAGDLNYDCRVDFRDMAILGGDWLGHPSGMAAVAGNWLSCTWECN